MFWAVFWPFIGNSLQQGKGMLWDNGKASSKGYFALEPTTLWHLKKV